MFGRSSTNGIPRSLGLTVLRRCTPVISGPTAGRTWRFAFHDVGDLLGIDSFILHQGVGHHVELIAVVLEQLQSPCVAFINNAPHLFINRECCLV